MYSATNIPSLRLPPEHTWSPYARRRVLFGQPVMWHEYDQGGRHLTPAQLAPYRQQGDEEIDNILDLLHREGNAIRPGQDILVLAEQALEKSHQSEGTLSAAERALIQFYHNYSCLPEWVDVDQLQRGQQVFLAYSPIIGISLYYRSLVPGFSISKIAAVLSSTGYLAPPASRESVQERLIDTGAFLAECFGNPASVTLVPNGAAWKAALHVRALHAKVRRGLLQRPTSSQRAWKTAELGVPINQEDMAATLLAFSANSLVACEMVLGFALSRQEREDYLATWRYIGWLLGVHVYYPTEAPRKLSKAHRLRPLDPCGPGWNPKRADRIEHSTAIFESIVAHIMDPDASSVKIAHHLLRIGRKKMKEGEEESMNNVDGVKKKHSSDEFWFYFRCLQCRRFVGNALADALRLPVHPIWWRRWLLWGFSTTYFVLLTLYTAAALPWSPLRETIIRFHQKHTRQFVVDWQDSHAKRMQAKLGVTHSCPFAMVAPPQHSL
jgi:hypothetical protein